MLKGVKECCTDSIHSGDSGWRRSKNRKSGSIEKMEFDDGKNDVDDVTSYVEEVKQVSCSTYDQSRRGPR